jgi:hypothetical protein
VSRDRALRHVLLTKVAIRAEGCDVKLSDEGDESVDDVYAGCLTAYYQRLTTAGKLPKVALVACMRKLLTTLNAMVKAGSKWDPEHCRA